MATAVDHALCFGPDNGDCHVLFVPPLFDEGNRTRRTIVAAMRLLSAQGIAAHLPELPGQYDSIMPTGTASLTQWRSALADYAKPLIGRTFVASFRGGALIDDGVTATGWWRLAPANGASLLRTMLRARVAADREAGVVSSVDTLTAAGTAAPITLAGNSLSPQMLREIATATPAAVAPLRTLTLGTGPGELAGSALWLRAEPDEDLVMAATVAQDLTDWTKQCAAT